MQHIFAAHATHGLRHKADRAGDGAASRGAAVEDPLEHADILAKARPHKAARRVLEKPVDVEDLWQLEVGAAAEAQPVLEVVLRRAGQ